MYCIECGAQIPDNSKFCPHCGKKQTEGEPTLKEKIAEVIIEKEITRQVIEAHNSSIDKEFLKKSMGWYLAWVLLHLGCLLIGSDEIFSEGGYFNDFWPFGKDDIGDYDFREFLVYTIFPLAILVIWSMVLTQEQNNINAEKKEENIN